MRWRRRRRPREAAGRAPRARHGQAPAARPRTRGGPRGRGPRWRRRRRAISARWPRRWRAFEHCELKRGARSFVFCDGAPAARMMIVGEAPGREEEPRGPALRRARGAVARPGCWPPSASTGGRRTRRWPSTSATSCPGARPRTASPRRWNGPCSRPFVEKHIALAAQSSGADGQYALRNPAGPLRINPHPRRVGRGAGPTGPAHLSSRLSAAHAPGETRAWLDLPQQIRSRLESAP